MRIGTRIIDGKKFAVKTIVKKRPLYVLMLVRGIRRRSRLVPGTYLMQPPCLALQRNEIRILEGLQHPYIIQMVDAFEEPDVVQCVAPQRGGEVCLTTADHILCPRCAA